MILTRLGNKTKIASEIQHHFPEHALYMEPFFGAGGMFFNKPKVKYNIVNDVDNDVFNLYDCVRNRKEELLEAFVEMPYHQRLLKHWKENKETDPIRQAIRFVFLSNFTFLGKGTTLRFGRQNSKALFIQRIRNTFEFISDVQFSNVDFRRFFKQVSPDDVRTGFVYSDPPYLETANNYSQGFTEQDSADLFECLMNSNAKFAMSEFDHPFIIDQAKKHGLNVIIIGERKNLLNRRTEILVTNYTKQSALFSE